MGILRKRIDMVAILSVCCILGFFQSAGFCGALDGFAGLEGTISIAGGTAHIPVMNDAAKNIMTFIRRSESPSRVEDRGWCPEGWGRTVEIGNTGRALSDEEIAKYGLKSFAFALDGVATAVHPDNPVYDLSPQQVREIFAGSITNWKDVAGRDTSIHLFSRDEAAAPARSSGRSC